MSLNDDGNSARAQNSIWQKFLKPPVSFQEKTSFNTSNPGLRIKLKVHKERSHLKSGQTLKDDILE